MRFLYGELLYNLYHIKYKGIKKGVKGKAVRKRVPGPLNPPAPRPSVTWEKGWSADATTSILIDYMYVTPSP